MHGNYKELHSTRNTLEICEFVCSEDEKAVLKNEKKLDNGRLLQAALEVEKKAFWKLFKFEGRANPSMENTTNKERNSSRAKKSTYLAVGLHVKKYKQGFCLHLGLPKTANKTQPLLERPADMD